MFIFFVCPKKTNQQRSGERKGTLCHSPCGQATLLSACGGYPAFLKVAGIKKTRPPMGGLKQSESSHFAALLTFCSFSATFPVLGGVSMGKSLTAKAKKTWLKLGGNQIFI